MTITMNWKETDREILRYYPTENNDETNEGGSVTTVGLQAKNCTLNLLLNSK
jgi:hypothetical protein